MVLYNRNQIKSK